MKDWLLNDTELIEDYENVLCQMTSGKWIPIVKMDKTDMGCGPNVSKAVEMFSTWQIADRYLQNDLSKLKSFWLSQSHTYCIHTIFF